MLRQLVIAIAALPTCWNSEPTNPVFVAENEVVGRGAQSLAEQATSADRIADFLTGRYVNGYRALTIKRRPFRRPTSASDRLRGKIPGFPAKSHAAAASRHSDCKS